MDFGIRESYIQLFQRVRERQIKKPRICSILGFALATPTARHAREQHLAARFRFGNTARHAREQHLAARFRFGNTARHATSTSREQHLAARFRFGNTARSSSTSRAAAIDRCNTVTANTIVFREDDEASNTIQTLFEDNKR